jgi:hypothetical protein
MFAINNDENYFEMLCLYIWWRKVRPNREFYAAKELDEISLVRGNERQTMDKTDPILIRYRELIDEHILYECSCEEDDNEKLMRLIKLRPHFYTEY